MMRSIICAVSYVLIYTLLASTALANQNDDDDTPVITPGKYELNDLTQNGYILLTPPIELGIVRIVIQTKEKDDPRYGCYYIGHCIPSRDRYVCLHKNFGWTPFDSDIAALIELSTDNGSIKVTSYSDSRVFCDLRSIMDGVYTLKDKKAYRTADLEKTEPAEQ